MAVLDYEREPIPDDVAIARDADPAPVGEIAGKLGLSGGDLERYGDYKAKLTAEALERVRQQPTDGNLVLVTGMTPTPAGEGKTVTAIGLSQALSRIGESSAVALREPSLGPVFGIKGGAAGGGYAQVLPMEDINLHFTGDLHAITAAHNTIAAMLDAHVHHGNDLGIDVRRGHWERALDVNDRALRDVVVGLGGEANGYPRETGFQITAASELMAILCLAEDLPDLKRRVGCVVVAEDADGDPVTVDDLEATGAVAALLRDAFRPNLVGTIEDTPAFVHGGPFANIAHGTNSVVADEVGLTLSDYLVTEAGFGSDLGFEKFANVVARRPELHPDAVVLVATVRALKRHGREVVDGDTADVEAVRVGLWNLDHHLRIVGQFDLPVVVALNRFGDDTASEVRAVLDHCEERGVPVEVSDVYARGGAGGEDLARTVTRLADRDGEEFHPLYDLDESLTEKVRTVATEVYGASGVDLEPSAREDFERLERQGYGDLPVCIAKTPTSVTDDPDGPSPPEEWSLSVREATVSAGAGFVVVLTGDVLTMPGLPADPAATDIDVDPESGITGLF